MNLEELRQKIKENKESIKQLDIKIQKNRDEIRKLSMENELLQDQIYELDNKYVKVICETCNGTGIIVGDKRKEKCFVCKGKGWEWRRKWR